VRRSWAPSRVGCGHRAFLSRTVCAAIPITNGTMRRDVVRCTIRPLSNRTTAELKTWLPRVAKRPAAGVRPELPDLFGDAGGCGLRRDAERSGTAICPGGGLLELVDCHPSRGQQADQDVDPARDTTIAIAPAPHTPRANAEQLGDTALGDVKRVECRAEFSRDDSMHRGTLPQPRPVSSGNA